MTRALAVLAALSFIVACDPDPDEGDAGEEDSSRPDTGPVELYPSCESTLPPGTTPLAPVPSTLIGTIDLAMPPLSSVGPINPATEAGEVMYREMGLDNYTRGPGQVRVTRMELGGAAPPSSGRRSLAYFVHYADFQLVDDESPTRLAYVDNAVAPGGMRAQEAYIPRGVSAMNRTLTRIMRPERPYDFGVITGDCADSAQENETRWVVDLMNGAAGLHTDSGDDDDPVPGPDNDPKDPFDATVFPGEWLYVAGNHDVLIVGIGLLDDDSRMTVIGDRPEGGTRDWRLRWGAVSRRTIPADPMRRLLERQDIVDILRADTNAPGPVGHGFDGTEDISIGANWEYDAIPGFLRIINLDTSDDTGGSLGLVRRATVDQFLIPALDRAQADGVLVMLASHHATTSIDVFAGQFGSEVVPDAVPASELEMIAAARDNVIAWLVGHSHENRVRAIAGPDADHPGYWEIMTGAMADWPGQARIIEVVDNGDGNVSILGTLIDFDEESCAEQRFRRLLIMERLSLWGDQSPESPMSMNVELVRPIPAALATTVSDATGVDRIESETTLRGDP